MTEEKWEIVKGNIKDKFRVSDEGQLTIDEEGGIEIEYLEFESPIGRMRLEFVIKPVVLDKKTTYSRRVGSETKVDYVYSPDEKTSVMMAYKWHDETNDWTEIEADNFKF